MWDIYMVCCTIPQMESYQCSHDNCSYRQTLRTEDAHLMNCQSEVHMILANPQGYESFALTSHLFGNGKQYWTLSLCPTLSATKSRMQTCSLIIWSLHNPTKAVKGQVFSIRMKWADFVNRSTITHTVKSWQCVASKPVKKSQMIKSHFHLGSING